MKLIFGAVITITIVTVTVFSMSIASQYDCLDFLNKTYRVGHYDFWSGRCYVKTNNGDIILRNNMKITSIYK